MGSENSDSTSLTSEGEEDWPGFYLPVYNRKASISQQDCFDAMRGEYTPTYLRDARIIACIVRGLRYNERFAESELMTEICTKSANKILCRARNARLIMSNKIPLITDDEEIPYCIWYPHVATVDTYRELVKRYPDMRYHVGRACAVGGYIDLYRELDVLPDSSIAEEAYHNLGVVGSKEIFDLITSQATLYAVLDDYSRSVNWKTPRRVTGMNGDTAIFSSLNVKFGVWGGWHDALSYYFNITEDYSIGEASSPETHNPPLAPEHVSLLYNPLPLHLPTTNKDALILHAAYEGNIDRYARLRRPRLIPDEAHAVIRGIYHHTAFARWYHGQPKSVGSPERGDMETAIEARFIMVNDLSRMHTTTKTEHNVFAPFMIWWPLIPQEATLRELARRRPDMKLQISIACIVADYRRLWDELSPEPHLLLMRQATQEGCEGRNTSRNYYVEYLERREAEKKIDAKAYSIGIDIWTTVDETIRRDKEPTTIRLVPEIRASNNSYHDGVLVDCQQPCSIYPGGLQANAAEWELCIAVDDNIREQARTERDKDSLWENWGWPYSCWEAQTSYNGPPAPPELLASLGIQE